MKKIINSIALAVLMGVFLVGCGAGKAPSTTDGDQLRVVTTTTIIADVTRELAGDLVEVEALMGPGVDPHLYKASAGDVKRMANADMVIYNGLHLEGRMGGSV